MADRGYVLIEVANPFDTVGIERIMKELYEDESVEFLDQVLGNYQLIAMIESKSLEDTVVVFGAIAGIKTAQLCKVAVTPHHPADPIEHSIGPTE